MNTTLDRLAIREELNQVFRITWTDKMHFPILDEDRNPVGMNVSVHYN